MPKLHFNPKVSALLLAAGLLAAPLAANASVTFQGVTFTSSISGNILTIELDAMPPLSGDWSNAVSIGALSVQGSNPLYAPGVSFAGGPAGWTLNTKELNANGCAGGAHANNACMSGAAVPLTNDMMFKFMFASGTPDPTPSVKVLFLDANGDKTGSLFSTIVPVPEPETYAMMLAGLGILAFLGRARKA